jgi:hypothetical protein
MVIPRKENNKPRKSTQVMPKEIPNIFIFPNAIPMAITRE